MGEVSLGTQGWSYPAWVGPFYPEGTPQASMLQLYAKAFQTVEVDSTFYGLPPTPVVTEWSARVPEDFVFSLKLPQAITHTNQLVDVDELIEQFLERVRLLGAHLGPLLVQLSPAFRATDGNRFVFREFLNRIPGDFRWAVEFRDGRWIDSDLLEQLRAKNVALALVDGRWLRRRVVLDLVHRPTADFAYIRWMGPSRRITDYSHVQIDRESELSTWARAIEALRKRVRTVYGYFNNHFQGHSPQSVRDMQQRLGQTPVPPASLQEQVELFS